MTRLILLRHGESTGNVERRLQSRAPYPLTETGRRQSASLAERLRPEGIDALYTSPAARACETGERIAAVAGLAARVLDEVGEYDFGEIADLTMSEISERRPDWVAAFREGRPPPDVEGEEGEDRFRERACAALWALVERHPAETVAVVTHSWVISVFCQSALGVERPPGFFRFDNCSITVVDVDPDGVSKPGHPRATIVTLNDARHMVSEG